MNTSNFYTLVVPAGQGATISAPGAVLTIKTVTGPLTVQMNGGGSQPVASGSALTGPFKFLTFCNAGSVAVTVGFYAGDNIVPYAPADNSASNAKSVLLGNLGIATGAAAANGNPACDGAGYLQVTNAMYLLVSGTRNGARRQVLYLSVSPTSAVGLNVLDSNSSGAAQYAGITLAPGSQIELLTDSDVILSGNGGTAAVTVGQIFLTGV